MELPETMMSVKSAAVRQVPEIGPVDRCKKCDDDAIAQFLLYSTTIIIIIMIMMIIIEIEILLMRIY